METKTNSGRNLIMNLPRQQVLSEMFDISPYSTDKSLFSKREQEELDKIINNISSDSTDSEQEENLKDVKETKTYYIFFKELDKSLNICISKLKPKEYFACVLCDEDKDLIMEFENHFKYNADYIEVPKRWKYSNYRIHNLTKDKLKQEMDKFINKLGVGYYLDYFSTIKNWTGKD